MSYFATDLIFYFASNASSKYYNGSISVYTYIKLYKYAPYIYILNLSNYNILHVLINIMLLLYAMS